MDPHCSRPECITLAQSEDCWEEAGLMFINRSINVLMHFSEDSLQLPKIT